MEWKYVVQAMMYFDIYITHKKNNVHKSLNLDYRRLFVATVQLKVWVGYRIITSKRSFARKKYILINESNYCKVIFGPNNI